MSFKGTVNAKALSELYGMPYYHKYDIRFDFNRTVGIKFKKSRNGAVGYVMNLSFNKKRVGRLRTLLNKLADQEKRKEVPCFFSGVMCFVLFQIKDKIKYVKCDRNRGDIVVKKSCESLKFPDWAKGKLENIWESNYTFEEFLADLHKVPKTYFNLQSAIDAYRMQGEKAIFSILVQACTIYREGYPGYIRLTPDLPLVVKPEVSHFVSGCTFPVAVSPFFEETRWEKGDESIFLVNERDEAVDCAKIGGFDCFSQNLDGRLKFLSRYKNGSVPYVICHTWLEIVEAVGLFGGDVVVRPLLETLLVTSWHRFGPGGLLTAWGRNDVINIRDRTSKGRRIVHMPEGSYMGDHFQLLVTSLDGVNVSYDVGSEQVVWSLDEMQDWIDLGQLCKEKIEEYRDRKF